MTWILRAEVTPISTSTSKKLVIGILLLFTVSAVSAEFYYNDGGYSSSSITDSNYFSVPEYDSQQEILSELVAPFIFIATLLNVALSKALVFILAQDENPDWTDQRGGVPIIFPMRDNRPDVSRYSMVMSLAITSSLIATPYWDIIRGLMASFGVLVTIAIVILPLYLIYLAFG